MKYAKSVDEYLNNNPEKRDFLEKLREILLNTELEETIKWGMPTYTIKGKNIVGMGAFKDWACLWFHNGSLLSDPDKVLINAQEGKTKALRQWRFRSLDEIDNNKIAFYLLEAIDNHRKGKKVDFGPPQPDDKIKFEIPELLQGTLDGEPVLNEAFKKLTLRQQRDYAEYISEPKRETTRKSRLEKIIPLIAEGKPIAKLWS